MIRNPHPQILLDNFFDTVILLIRKQPGFLSGMQQRLQHLAELPVCRPVLNPEFISMDLQKVLQILLTFYPGEPAAYVPGQFLFRQYGTRFHGFRPDGCFKKWLGLTTAGDVSAEERSMNKQRIAAIYTLADKGLIQNREGILFLHDLIREVIGAEEEVAPSIQRCKTLIWNLCILCVPEKPEALEEPLPEGLFSTAENVVKWARKDDEELYWKFLSAVFSAMVLHGYQSGVRLLAGELRQRLGPTGTPLDIVRKSFDHYLHAATADTQEEAEQEHQAALENLGNLPIEEALQSSDKKELNWLLGQQMGGLTWLLEKAVGKKGMADLDKKFQQECAYFQTEEGRAELSGQISEFLKIATPAAQDIQAGKRSKVTIRDLLSPFLGKKK